jgi:tripartite ATP-independent transporter DctP family solute receptor
MLQSLRTFAALAVSLAAVFGPLSARADDPIVMKIATVAPDNTPWSELLKRYEKAVEEKSGHRIDVKIFLGGTLGDENESVVKCKRGQIQAVGASTGAVASQVPEVNVIELPYLFRNADEADYVIDNVLTAPLEGIFRKYGLVLGFWSENGFRQFGSRDGFVKTPADLAGKKMRSQESPIHLEMWKAFGASPVPIPTTEVLTALQTGTVDGFDQATLFTIAASWHKTVKYFTVSNHLYQPALIAFNQEWFDKLPADLQKILVDEGRALQVKGRKAVRKIEPDLIAVLKASNVQVYELSDDEKKVFEQKAMPVRDYLRKNQGPDAAKLLDATEKALADYRAGKK